MPTVERGNLPQGIVIDKRLLTPEDSSHPERLVYKVTERDPKTENDVFRAVKVYDPTIVSDEQLAFYAEVINGARERLKGFSGGYIGATMGEGVKFRWNAAPVIRVQKGGSEPQTVSEYQSGLRLKDLFSTKEELAPRIRTLEITDQEAIFWLMEVLSHPEEKELLERNMETTSEALNTRLGVKGIKFTEDDTRLLVVPTMRLVLLVATDIAPSVNDIHRVAEIEPAQWPGGDA